MTPKKKLERKPSKRHSGIQMNCNPPPYLKKERTKLNVFAPKSFQFDMCTFVTLYHKTSHKGKFSE